MEADAMAFSKRYAVLPAEVVEAYARPTGGAGLCSLALREICNDRVGALRRILGDVMPSTAELIANHISKSFFVDDRTHKAPEEPYRLYLVVPTGHAVLSFALHSAVRWRDDDRAEKLSKPIPPTYLPLALTFESVAVHLTSPAYIGVGEVNLSSHPADTTTITAFVKGRAQRPLKKRFPDPDSVRVFGQHGEDAWFICFDKNAQDPALWLVCDGGRTVARLSDPAAAYDAMGMHYLSGRKEPFDFRPFSE
jgi:hypothetical protein